MKNKVWGGAFSKQTHPEVEAFTTSIGVDHRLWKAEIRASQSHARMLGRQGIIATHEAKGLIEALDDVASDIEKEGIHGRREQFDSEDIHSEIERRLHERVGSLAGKLHTARSRNDQVATDLRIYLREEIENLSGELNALQNWLCRTAQIHIDTLLPGLTHTQHAQPVSLAHHLLAYFWMLQRDQERLAGLNSRVNVMPLGSAALAGTSFPIDRIFLAKELEFSRVSENSLDGVSDRDFVVEFLACASLIAMHFSRLAEELILWSTPEFGFVTLDDAVTTGSSIMPQKKNPDVAELIRGRTGRVYGALMGSLTMMKALPLAYHRDLQEDKVLLFDGLDIVRACARLMLLMLENAEFNSHRMRSALAGDFSNATDLADALAAKGMPFREAHEISGRVVQYCTSNGIKLEDLSLTDLSKFSPMFDAATLVRIQHDTVMRARQSDGGTAPSAVRNQLTQAATLLSKFAESSPTRA